MIIIYDIIDFDTDATISTLGPFTTTGDDIWETNISLGDVDLLGSTTVAFLMEPLSHLSTDAYPCLSSDDVDDPQGSVYGALDDIEAIGSSTIGNFLMNIYIKTEQDVVVMAPRAIDLPVAVNATPRVGTNNVVNGAIINQIATYADGSRDLNDLTLWDVNRIEVLNEAGSTTTLLIDQTTDQIVTDTDWGTVVPGVFEWTVSDPISSVNGTSNTLEVEMETEVTITVTTEFSDDPNCNCNIYKFNSWRYCIR